MTLIPIDLPPGVYRNGTEYGASGRWYDCNLVRWQDGALRPIGGWQPRVNNVGSPIEGYFTAPTPETSRDIITYRDNSGGNRIMVGTNRALYSLTQGGVVTDVTPIGFTGGPNDISLTIGYGIGPYGLYSYGTERNQVDVIPTPVGRWKFDMWGENVLASFDGEGVLYEFAPTSLNAVLLSNAPAEIQDFIVTDERIVMAVTNGSSGIRNVVWSEKEDNDNWTPTISNFAGQQNLQGSGLLVGIYKVQGQPLILSETDAFVVSYLGPPFVYGFTRVGERCGPIYKRAVIATDRFVMWLGKRNFWFYDGTLKPMNCDIIDYIRATLDTSHVSKMFTMTISDFSEIWWFYQSFAGSEVDTYVSYNYQQDTWAFGKLARTTGIDRGPLRSVIMLAPDGKIFNHEQSGVFVANSYAQTGPIELKATGTINTAIRSMIIDTKDFGTVSIEFLSRQFPTDPLYSHGVRTYAHPLSTTGVMGREIHIKVRGVSAGWRFGTPRVDVQQIGGGRR
jgi:hypothetical protein